MILGFFPKKAAFPALFPAFPARSRPGSSLEMCGFPPAEKAPSKGNVGGTPVQPQYRGTACPLPSLPENGGDFGENKVRQRTGAVAVRRYGATPVLQHGRSSQPKDQALP